jgi:hypothetical protein
VRGVPALSPDSRSHMYVCPHPHVHTRQLQIQIHASAASRLAASQLRCRARGDDSEPHAHASRTHSLAQQCVRACACGCVRFAVVSLWRAAAARTTNSRAAQRITQIRPSSLWRVIHCHWPAIWVMRAVSCVRVNQSSRAAA